jgi:hypothetical protein
MFLNVRFKLSKDRTADDGGQFTTYYYHILPSTPAAAIEQYIADQKEAKYEVIKDEETGMYIYRNYRMVPKGCTVKRSQKGKWYADTSKYRELAELNKMFPGLDLGKHLAQQLIGGADITADITPQVTNIDNNVDAGDIDPFKS